MVVKMTAAHCARFVSELDEDEVVKVSLSKTQMRLLEGRFSDDETDGWWRPA